MNEENETLAMNPDSMETSAIAGATAGSSLDAALDSKADKSEIVRLDAALEAHNDSATAHPDIRADVTEVLTCHNSNANAHADLRSSIDSKVDKVTGMGLSSNDYTAEEKANLAVNTSTRHIHNNKTLLDSYTQTDASLSEAVTKKHSHENKSVLDGITSTLLNGWNSAVSHIADGVKHITATERSGWNAKADQSYVDAEMQNKANLAEVHNLNLLDNWYFTNPINQQGKDSYTGEWEFTIDRYLKSTGITVAVDAHGVKLTGSGDVEQNYIFQRLEFLPAGRYTYSLLFAENTGKVWISNNSIDNGLVNVAPSVEPSGLITFTFYSPVDLNPTYAFFRIHTSAELRPIAVKLELGSVQTLARRENDAWILNDAPPNPQQELAKCQRYQLVLTRFEQWRATQILQNYIDFCIPIPTTFRASPKIIGDALTVVNINGVPASGLEFAVAVASAGASTLRIRATKTAHGLTDATLEVGLGDALLDANI